jgi:hypothetical protein
MLSASNRKKKVEGLYFYLIYTNSSLTSRLTPYEDVVQRRERERACEKKRPFPK